MPSFSDTDLHNRIHSRPPQQHSYGGYPPQGQQSPQPGYGYQQPPTQQFAYQVWPYQSCVIPITGDVLARSSSDLPTSVAYNLLF